MRYLPAIILCLAACTSVAAADDTPAPTPKMVSWKCTFPGYTEPSHYVYMVETGKGFATGNLGTSPEFVHVGTDAISFVEPIQTGAVQTLTSLLKTGEAVLSHHTIYDGVFSQSQVMGSCEQTNSTQ